MNDLYMVNPFSDDDLRMVKDFNTDTYHKLLNIRKNYNYDEYLNLLNYSVVSENYYSTIKDSKIVNFFTVCCEKDTRISYVYPIVNLHSRDIINKITENLILNQSMEEVFVFVLKDDIKTLNSLTLDNNYISLFTKDDTIYVPFVKDRSLEMEFKRRKY